MKKKIVSLAMAAAVGAMLFTGCSNNNQNQGGGETAKTETTAESNETETKAETGVEDVTLKVVCDLTPHSEILESAKDALAKEGITIDVVSTEWSPTWNEMLIDGEVDFAYFMHVPAMESIMDEMGATLYSAGGIHVEPYACFSNKYESLDELPEGAKIALPNDASNEYRALKVLEDNGYLDLSDDITSLTASVAMVDEYLKDIELIELDQANIIPMGDDFDAYFVNVNRALEAGLDTTAYLMREGEDSEYANIITVTEANKDNPAIAKMVEILKSPEVKKFIEDKYNGAVIPAK